MHEHAEKAELGVPASVPSAAFGTYSPGALQAMLIGLARRCPHNRGGRLAALALRKLVLWTLRRPLDLAADGIELRAWLRDNVSERQFLFMPWHYDRAERDFIARFLPADGLFVDIGANVGIYTLWAALFLSERGTIVCFEPNPQAHARLAFNLEVNRRKRPGSWPRIHVLNVGVSDRDETLTFHLHPANLGAGSLVVASPHRSKMRIPCVTLLRQLQDLQVQHVDVLKIDIEGAEEQALVPFLQAAPEGLLPDAMIIENSDYLWKADLRARFLERGYAELMRTRMNTVYGRGKAASRTAGATVPP